MEARNKMKLMTDELKQSMPLLYSQENEPDPTVRVKYFTPWAEWSWWGIEFDGTDTFFGLVDGYDQELGYFSLSELESISGPAGLKIERDLSFEPTNLSNVSRVFKERLERAKEME